MLSANVTNTDPAYRRDGHLGVALETFDPKVVTAEPMDRLGGATCRRPHERIRRRRGGDPRHVRDQRSARAAGSLPGNLILTRDAGDHRPRLQPINERFGWPWGCFVEMPVERGIALALGMHTVDVLRLDPHGFGLSAEEAYAAWADLAADALGSYQALYVHVKGPDIPAHDGRAEDKRDVIEAIDRAFFGEDAGADPRTALPFSADHATSCVRKAHTADPVPLVIAGGPFTPDGSTTYGERACAAGSLGSSVGWTSTCSGSCGRTRPPGKPQT